jgi:hypothetical protein
MKRAFLILSLLITGCSTIDEYVAGWPQLKTTIHDSNLLEINQKCWGYLPLVYKLLGSVSFGCTLYNFDEKTCDIYLVPNSPQFIVNHELAHCNGGDHPDHTLDKAYDYWLDVHAQVSDHYDKIPPRILFGPSGIAYWDNSSKFGAIPNELFSGVQKFCRELNQNDGVTYKTIGYHPLAQDFNGQTFVGGGYFCVPE